MLERIQGVAPGAIQAYSAKSGGFTAGTGDRGTLFDCTGSFTASLAAAATLGAGWSCWFRNVSGTQSIDPNGTEQINGATTYAVSNAGDVVLVECTGAAFVVSHAQLPAGVAITGGTINGATLGVTTPAAAKVSTLSISGAMTIADAQDVTVGTGTGTKIGTATSQKLGFWNVTPIIQPAGAAQAAASAQSQQALTDSTGGTPSTTLAAIAAGALYAQADMTAVKNAIASLAAQLALIKTDVTNVKTLEDAIRTALVNSGQIKGAA